MVMQWTYFSQSTRSGIDFLIPPVNEIDGTSEILIKNWGLEKLEYSCQPKQLELHKLQNVFHFVLHTSFSFFMEHGMKNKKWQ